MRQRLMFAMLAIGCVVALSAVASSAASAAGAEWFTCVKEAPGGYSDSHCTEEDSLGEYTHKEISIPTLTEMTLLATTNEVITSVQFGAELILTASELECVSCSAENEKVGGVFHASGSGRLLFKKVSLNVANCTVEDPVKGPGTIFTEPLKFSTTSKSGYKWEPVTPSTFAVIHIVGASCSIAGNYTLTGTAFASATGATFSFNVTTELKMNKKAATLVGKGTQSAGHPGEPHNPMTLTEV